MTVRAKGSGADDFDDGCHDRSERRFVNAAADWSYSPVSVGHEARLRYLDNLLTCGLRRLGDAANSFTESYAENATFETRRQRYRHDSRRARVLIAGVARHYEDETVRLRIPEHIRHEIDEAAANHSAR